MPCSSPGPAVEDSVPAVRWGRRRRPGRDGGRRDTRGPPLPGLWWARAEPRPFAADPLPGHATGLVCAVTAVEPEVLAVAGPGSRATALTAFAPHPLTGPVTVARRLVERCTEGRPGLAYLA